MTVDELIDMLGKYDADIPVFLPGYEEGYNPVVGVIPRRLKRIPSDELEPHSGLFAPEDSQNGDIANAAVILSSGDNGDDEEPIEDIAEED